MKLLNFFIWLFILFNITSFALSINSRRRIDKLFICWFECTLHRLVYQDATDLKGKFNYGRSYLNQEKMKKKTTTESRRYAICGSLSVGLFERMHGCRCIWRIVPFQCMILLAPFASKWKCSKLYSLRTKIRFESYMHLAAGRVIHLLPLDVVIAE